MHRQRLERHLKLVTLSIGTTVANVIYAKGILFIFLPDVRISNLQLSYSWFAGNVSLCKIANATTFKSLKTRELPLTRLSPALEHLNP